MLASAPHIVRLNGVETTDAIQITSSQRSTVEESSEWDSLFFSLLRSYQI
jgi:hypothetical protein